MTEQLKVNGIYEHYKGKRYQIIALGINEENLEEVVIYKALYDTEEFGKNPVFVRSKKVFLQAVNINGKEIPRFKLMN